MKTIRDIIGEREVFSVDKSATIQEVVEYVNEKHVGAVAVCDDNDLVGVFSERDLLRRVVLKGLDPTTEKIAKVMTKKVFHVSIDEEHNVAQALMLSKNIRHLVVVDEENRLCGFVSMRELLLADLEESKDLIRKLNDDYHDHQFQVPKK